MRQWLWGVWLVLFGQLGWATSFSGPVVAVLDGDTLLVGREGRRPVKVRLAGIDAPEKAQPYGIESRDALARQVLKQEVEVTVLATDKYGRWVGRITLAGRDVCQEQVRLGMAWEYSYFRRDAVLAALQHEARQSRRGLWARPNPQPPWQWRKVHGGASGGYVRQDRAASDDFHCGRKHRCAEMRSCDEAHYFLSRCGLRTLDGDGDGIPCPEVCLHGK